MLLYHIYIYIYIYISSVPFACFIDMCCVYQCGSLANVDTMAVCVSVSMAVEEVPLFWLACKVLCIVE